MAGTDGTVRRQARGERRMGEILDAAAMVLARDGYEGTTTNAVAREAGVSPGSLYQYFRNKEEIAAALTRRYVEALGEAQGRAFDVDVSGVDELVERVLEPLVEFNVRHAGFKALFARTDMPPALAEATAPLHRAMQERIVGLLVSLAPHAAHEDVRRAAVVAIQMVRGTMPLVVGADDGRMAVEMRRAVSAYLADALGVPR